MESWERIATKVIATLRDVSEYDVITSKYCEACPVRTRLEHVMRGRRKNWYLSEE